MVNSCGQRHNVSKVDHRCDGIVVKSEGFNETIVHILGKAESVLSGGNIILSLSLLKLSFP